jgi:hypothetical protein
VGGSFWAIDAPSLRVRGEFTSQHADELAVRLTEELMPDPRVHLLRDADGRVIGQARSGSAAHSVEAFMPITLQGDLDNGMSVTLLRAHNHGGAMIEPPRYVADTAVLGAHVSDEQLYAAVRFRVDHPYWLGHLASDQTSRVEDDGSTLGVEESDDGNWLVYISSAPMTLRQLDIRAVSGCLALFHLAIDRPLTIREIHLRVETGGAWVQILGNWFGGPSHGLSARALLGREELTVARLAKWIALNDTLDGLAQAVAQPIDAPLQIRAQVATSLVEGLHRRLPYQQKKFPNASNSAIDNIKQAARRAAAEKAASTDNLDPEVVKAAVREAVAHIGEVDYASRVDDVIDQVRNVIPEIAESVSDLPTLLVKMRNDRAHHFVDTKEALDTRVLRWLLVATATPWLLRALLLLHAGVEPNILREKYLLHQRFSFFQANAAKHAAELAESLNQSRTTPS